MEIYQFDLIKEKYFSNLLNNYMSYYLCGNLDSILGPSNERAASLQISQSEAGISGAPPLAAAQRDVTASFTDRNMITYCMAQKVLVIYYIVNKL